MFSKALFKQSCKANGILWGIITFAVCFMLASVMIISGNGNMSTMKNGISHTIVESTLQSEMKGRAINYYLTVSEALEGFDTAFLTAYQESLSQGAEQEVAQQNALGAGLGALNDFVNKKATESGFALPTEENPTGSVEYQELQGLVFEVININPTGLMNPDSGVPANFDALYESWGFAAPRYDLANIVDANREEYRLEYSQKNSSIFLAGNMTSDTNIDNIVKTLENFDISREDYINLTYKDESGDDVSMFTGETGIKYINSLANTAIVTFNARVAYEVANGKEYEVAAKEILGDMSASFLTNLPEDVSNALMELGGMDLYGMIVGSMFYKMAGLLLPIIYMIMCANNLIAGQVDSGSMAYVLSTSTKRKQVVFTQAVFLIGSLFVMFCLATVTSFICLACVDGAMVTLTFGQLALLNLGAFLTLFAMSGICFFASCFFNRGKHSMSVGGGLNMFFLVATMLGLFGSSVLPSVVRLKALNFFNYVSLISLFDVTSILSGTLTFLWKWAILIVVGVVFYVVGSIKFKKKDLPL